MPEVGLIITAKDDKATAVMKKVGSQGEKALGGIATSSKQASQAVQRLPEQFGKASSAIMLLQGSTASLGGEAAKALTQLTGLGAIIASGGPVGIAIAAATIAVVGITKAWDMFTSEVKAARDAQRALDRVFATSLVKLDEMKEGVRSLADEVKFYGQDSLTVAILKQWELVEANERGLASINAELDALRLSSVAVENLSDAERQHIANLLRIRDGARAVLAERKKALDQLETLANKEAERDAAQERRRKSRERSAKREQKEQKDAATALKNTNTVYALQATMDRGLTDLRMGNLKRIADLRDRDEARATALLKEHAAKRKEILDNQHQQSIDMFNNLVTTSAGFVDQSITAMMDWNATATDKLKSIGMSALNIAKQIALELLVTEVTGAIAKTALKKAEATGSITASAGEAAAGASAATAAIPVVGPALAPAAAASTFASTIAYLAPALAAFEAGGMVGRTGIATVHKDEQVVNAGRTKKLHEWIDGLDRGGQGGGSTINVNMNTQIQNPEEMTPEQIKRWFVKAAKPIEDLIADNLVFRNLKRA